MLRHRRIVARGLAVAVLGLLAACGGKDEGGGGPGGRKGGNRPVEVGYIVVQPTTVALSQELSGRAVAYQSSEVRPQVTGLIQKRLFAEGSFVRAGQPLYRIDPSLYRAAVGQAEANLASAQAARAAADVLVARYKPLAEIQAISAQDYTNAVASAQQAAASVGQARAALETARINLRFTTVPAPISGRIGRSLFTVGALVTSSQADPLATIQQLDPIYIDVQQSAADITRLRTQLATGGVQPVTAPVKITLEDGTAYPLTGTVAFSEVVVDPSTGAVTLRVRVPNPQGALLPGMFLRATFTQAQTSSAFLVPQGAVSRNPKGQATLTLVGAGNKPEHRVVTADRSQGDAWVVTNGLKPGDKVITQGLGNIRPASVLKPVPASAPQRIGPPGERAAPAKS